jgi:hypothetical protein
MLGRGEVVESDYYYGSRVRENLIRIDSFFNVALHPGHISVIAAMQPLFELAALLVKSVGADDSNLVEAFGTGPLLY